MRGSSPDSTVSPTTTGVETSTAESNEALFRFVEESSVEFEANEARPDARRAAVQVSVVKRDLLDLRNTFVRRNPTLCWTPSTSRTCEAR